MADCRSRVLSKSLTRTLIVIALFINVNFVECDNQKQESIEVSTEEWRPEHEEALDKVLECIYENKNGLDNMVMTMVRLKSLKNKQDHDSDYICLEASVEPKILDLIERTANGKDISKEDLFQLIKEKCKDDQMMAKNKNEDLLQAQGSETVPIYLRRKCKKSSILDLLNLINKGDAVIRKCDEKESRSIKDDDEKTACGDQCENEEKQSVTNEKKSVSPCNSSKDNQDESKMKSCSDSVTSESKSSEVTNDIDEQKNEKVNQVNLFRSSIPSTIDNRIKIDPNRIRDNFPRMQLASDFSLIPFGCIKDGRQYLLENNQLPRTDPLPYNPNIDPNLYYNWMIPNYQKSTYYRDVNAYESPSSCYSNMYCSKTDVQEGYL